MMIGLLLPSLAWAGSSLPNGYDRAGWGMTVPELQKQVGIERAEMSDGFGYAEHLEEDPDVYYQMTPEHERVEYYFYRGRLYKVFIIYDRVLFHTRFYEELIEKTKKTYGDPKDAYQEDFFGLPIQHTRWEDSTSILDLRRGAGFIYQVRIDKTTNEIKTKAQTKKKSI